MRFFSKLFRDEQAATAVEYSVMLALILLAILSVIGTVGMRAGGMWSGIESDLRSVGFFGQ